MAWTSPEASAATHLPPGARPPPLRPPGTCREVGEGMVVGFEFSDEERGGEGIWLEGCEKVGAFVRIRR